MKNRHFRSLIYFSLGLAMFAHSIISLQQYSKANNAYINQQALISQGKEIKEEEKVKKPSEILKVSGIMSAVGGALTTLAGFSALSNRIEKK
jgi:hypothetical protein